MWLVRVRACATRRNTERVKERVRRHEAYANLVGGLGVDDGSQDADVRVLRGNRFGRVEAPVCVLPMSFVFFFF